MTATSILRRRLCAVAGLALDASVAGFFKLVLPPRYAVQEAGLTAASIFRRRLCAVSPCSLDASVDGFSKLVLPPRYAVQRRQV